MEPASLCSSLSSLISLVSIAVEKFEALDCLVNERDKFACRYKQVVQAFSSEIREVEILFKTMINRGRASALSALLTSVDGKEAFDQLAQTLDSTRALLQEQEHATDEFIATTNAQRRDLSSLIFPIDTKLSQLKVIADHAFITLEAQRYEISRSFAFFYRLYLIHQLAVPNQSPVAGPIDVSKDDECLLDSLQVYFHSRPFRIRTASPDVVQRLKSLNVSRLMERHVHVMEALGGGWVEEQVGPHITIDALGRVQVMLMKHLSKFLLATGKWPSGRHPDSVTSTSSLVPSSPLSPPAPQSPNMQLPLDSPRSISARFPSFSQTSADRSRADGVPLGRRYTMQSLSRADLHQPRSNPRLSQRRGDSQAPAPETNQLPTNHVDLPLPQPYSKTGSSPALPQKGNFIPALFGEVWQTAELLAVMQRAIKREAAQKNTIAFCGMVKAGKSLFLNALIGQALLPSDDLPSTAWPCRLRHVNGLSVPHLKVSTSSFVEGIRTLQSRKYGEMMRTYTPPVEDSDPFAGILKDASLGADENMDTREAHLRVIYSQWVDLHPTTRANLLKFEHPGFKLATTAYGVDAICDLLGQINDIVRLCHRFRIPITMDGMNWPLLSVQFGFLRHKPVDGEYEFIDLPGIGESFDNYDFEDLIRRAAKGATAIVPIVSLKEVPRSDWRKLAAIIQESFGRAPDLVICTHLDQIARATLEEHLANVSKVFWPTNSSATHRVVPCSSKMGMSAYSLLRDSTENKPALRDVMKKESLVYTCAKEILGVGNPAVAFSRFTDKSWRRAIQEQLRESGLEVAVQRLTNDMVMNARRRALLLNGENIRRHLRRAVTDQRRILLEMRRSNEDYTMALDDFKKTKAIFSQALRQWAVTETSLEMNSISKLHRGFQVLEKTGLDAVAASVQSAARSAEDTHSGVLVFEDNRGVENFLQEAQKRLSSALSRLKCQFVALVRELADHSRAEHFKSLRDMIQGTSSSNLQPALQDELIGELSSLAEINAETFVLSTIQRHLVQTVSRRYSAMSAFQALEILIAQTFVAERTDYDRTQVPFASDDLRRVHGDVQQQSLNELGFMLRAPIAVIATIPWVLGIGLWPFLTQSTQYHLNRDDVEGQLTKRIVRPFLSQLKSEGQTTLKGMMKKASLMASEVVEQLLRKEEQRYESERASKDRPPSNLSVAEAMASLSNFLAAEFALLKIQEYLNQMPSAE